MAGTLSILVVFLLAILSAPTAADTSAYPFIDLPEQYAITVKGREIIPTSPARGRA